MKCKICGAKTTWDKSYGKENFIVCPHCHDEIAETIEKCRKIESTSSKYIAWAVILKMGYLKERRKK